MGSKILVSGLINIEANVSVGCFPIEYTPIDYLFGGIDVCLAGVGYNVSMGLKALGNDVALVSIVGKDEIAEYVYRDLAMHGIEASHIKPWLEKTCASVICFDEQGKRKIYCDLKNVQEIVMPYADTRDLAASCDGLVIANVNFNDELIRNARELGKPIFSDVQVLNDVHDPFNKRFMENADVLFLSSERVPMDRKEFMKAIWNEYHNKLIIMGCGKEGAIMYDGKSFHAAASCEPRPVVNTVGAGDAMFSCFVHSYLKGLDPVTCLDRAVVFASYKVGESGGGKGFLDEESLERLLAEL
ncbi:MAG: carbohydrate kinase family protein [Bacilli bacterium]|nr:carbohydrate kinase family protein [Bacilli bacterium]